MRGQVKMLNPFSLPGRQASLAGTVFFRMVGRRYGLVHDGKATKLLDERRFKASTLVGMESLWITIDVN